jgi:ferredoxin-NADP reductase/MOSC domain-containing protein YiiM/ferredoxin
VGRLVSVNVGLPKDVQWRDRTVHTGVWKRPVEGPQAVRALNIDGDGQGDLGGHGGPHRAVLVYQSAAYDHWASELGRDDLTPGAFGENFTVDGLPDDEVCIGDRYAIGTAVFEVSQPRVTCYRVGMRLQEPRLPALLVAHRRPGFYLRVVREGTVHAGDDIVRVAVWPDGMTVAEVDALLYLPGHDLAQVARARRIAALSPGWQESFRLIEAAGEQPGRTGNAGLTAAVAPPAWPGFRPLRVAAVQAETPSVRSVLLEIPDGTPLPTPQAGQFVTLRLHAADGAVVSRSWSLSGPPAAPGYRVSVKREPGGLGSALVHDALNVGDTVDVAAPRGDFTLAPGDVPVLLLSAGIGVTPVLAMLHDLAAGTPARDVWWVHVARSRAEHAFADEASALLQQIPGARSEICYTAAEDASPDVHHGRPDRALLESLGLPAGTHAYLCGPPGFVTALTGNLVALGLEAGHVHRELFSPLGSVTPGIAAGPAKRPHPPDGPPGEGPMVAFSRSRLTVPWDRRYGSVLELAEACDVPVRWSCRTGVCHTCEVALTDGRVEYEPDPVEPPAVGSVLTCCARPLVDLVVDL